MEIPGITFPILGDFELNFLPYFTVLGWKIYWYGVIIAIGFLLAVLYGVKTAPRYGLSGDDIVDSLIWAVPLGIVCARLYYVIFYRDASGTNPYFDGVGDLREIVAIWEGGLAIYGGVIGGFVGVLIATKLKKVSLRATLDVYAFGLLIGQSIGRWGNFTNREAYGVQTTIPWRMGLVYSFRTFYYHPTFLYESLWNCLGFLLMHFWWRKKRKFDGQMFLSYLAWYGLGRLFIEGLRTDSLYLGGSNLRVSQLLAGLTCVVALGALFYVFIFRHPEPSGLWVNRGGGNADADPVPEPEAQEEEPEEFDEELSEAFRILSGEAPQGESAEAPTDAETTPQAADEPALLMEEEQNMEAETDEGPVITSEEEITEE